MPIAPMCFALDAADADEDPPRLGSEPGFAGGLDSSRQSLKASSYHPHSRKVTVVAPVLYSCPQREPPCLTKERKARALSPPSHVIFSKALMEATARHRPKGTDLEDMYAFLPDQLGKHEKDVAEHAEPVATKAMSLHTAGPAGKRANSLTQIRARPAAAATASEAPRRRTRGSSTGANRKALVWKPKQSQTCEAFAGDRVHPALFRRGGC